MEPVAPADERIWNRACLTNVVPQNTAIVSAITPYQLVRLLTTPITLADSIKTTAMVDSGAMGNFIHPRFIELHELVTKTQEPLLVNNVNGRLLSRVDRQAEIRMTIGGHSEMLMFDIAPLGKHNIVLGLPWLQQHDPIVHWSSGKLTFASDYCEQQCLAVPASTFLNQRPIVSVTPLDDLDMELLSIEGAGLSAIDIPEHLTELTETIPEAYWDRMGVFDGQKAATTLPELQGPDVDFAIELDPTKLLPKPSHPYHMNQEEWAECRKVLDEMLSAGWAEPADVKCPMAASMFFVWKKDRTRRPVIDYQRLNDIMIKDSYLLPCIDEMMDCICGSEIFTKLDLKSGYNQIRIRPGDEWKMTFMTPLGPYRMRVMMFGFVNAPSCFQRYMDKVFAPLLYKNLENYLDDALNHHKTEAEHIKGVRDTLQCLQDVKLFCNTKKCEFHQKKIEFLRVDVSHEGFKMDDKKITDVVQWQRPTTVRGVREFIGFVNFYRCWILGFSDVVKPLHALFQKDHKWDWTENKQTAFEILKWHVSQAPVLVHANPERAFHMETDASNYAYGAVLSQKQTDGRHHPIGYMSKSMNPAERNYGIPDKEALAIVKGLQNWRHWLERMKLPVQILTDHKNLEYFARPHILNRCQMRWLEMLTHYNYEIHYCPGDKNYAADALS
jgi:hypothetical protein